MADQSAGGTPGSEATVTIGDELNTEWVVEPGLLGKFTEMNAREATPGIVSEHLANGAFEKWYTWPKRTPPDDPPWWRRSEVLYPEVESSRGVAYPWEPFRGENARVTFEHEVGGVHGREARMEREDALHRTYREPEARYQRITIWAGRAGVRQRLALPDQRTLEYEFSVWLRGAEDVKQCEVRLSDPRGTVFTEQLPISTTWTCHEITLQGNRESTSRYKESPFGEFVLSIEFEGRGHLDIDWARLRSRDAIEETFNPTTVEHIQEYDIPNIRWPGGNFVSQYHWRDGIGPIDQRPVRSELHWGGLEENYLGVNEFLTFCEITDVKPYLNIGFSDEIGPEEAADLVEYVNGDPHETELGRLRASHGHETPWNVEVWQVGNETYGSYQIGHTDAEDFAERFLRHAETMKERDPSITVIAAGIDPKYDDFGGNHWNEVLFRTGGSRIDGVDIHRYVSGAPDERDWDLIEFNQQLLLFPTQFETLIEQVRATAAEYGAPDALVTVGEWNLQPGRIGEERGAWYGTMAHAAFCSSMYNTFIRQGEAVRFAHQRDNAFKHRPFRRDLRPMQTANNATLKLYSEILIDDHTWHVRDTDVRSPTGRIDRHGQRIDPMDDIPFVDAVTVESQTTGRAHVFLTNRNLQEEYHSTIQFGRSIENVEGLIQSAPVALDATTPWKGEPSYMIDSTSLEGRDGTVSMSLPPASVVRLDITEESG